MATGLPLPAGVFRWRIRRKKARMRPLAFFLSQSEEEGAAILERWKSRYVIVDSRLVLTGEQDIKTSGIYRAFSLSTTALVWKTISSSPYEKDENGKAGDSSLLPAGLLQEHGGTTVSFGRPSAGRNRTTGGRSFMNRSPSLAGAYPEVTFDPALCRLVRGESGGGAMRPEHVHPGQR